MASAVGQALTGEHAREFVLDTLVLTEHIADLASARTDIARGNVAVGTDMSAQLGHEALAKTHNLAVALALGIEVRTALSAAHGERGQRVLEDLLETEELDDTHINGGMQSDTALVRTDRGIELDTEAAVYLNLALVVHPRNAEYNLSFRLDDTIKNACLNEIGALFNYGLERLEHLGHCLNKLGLAGVSFLNCFQQICQILIF